MRFVDSNVLLYAASKEAVEADKTATALALLEADDLALSVQVLQEFFVQSTRPTKSDRITATQAEALIESWLRFPVQEMTLEVFRSAVATSQRYRISYWDAAIIEAAKTLGCKQVLSEDLNDGQNYGGVRVVNPFAAKRPRRGPR